MKPAFTRITLRNDDMREYERVKKTWELKNSVAVNQSEFPIHQEGPSAKTTKQDNIHRRIGYNMQS